MFKNIIRIQKTISSSDTFTMNIIIGVGRRGNGECPPRFSHKLLYCDR